MSQGVLLVSHGSVDRLEDLPAFLANIRRGHPAPPELVAEVTRRYQVIGGSPLNAINKELAQRLQDELAMPVRAANRLWHPYPAEAIAELKVDRLAMIPLAQHSAHVYAEAVKKVAPHAVCAPNWGNAPDLIEAQASTIRPLVRQALLLTAHSLPKSVIAAGDAYEKEFRASCAAVGRAVGVEPVVAFQSQGMGTSVEWLGPDLASALDSIEARGQSHVVIAPIGFLADHVEILYDIDVEAQAMAKERGLTLVRAPSLNAGDAIVKVLARIARELLS
jgi:ferrochelatase